MKVEGIDGAGDRLVTTLAVTSGPFLGRLAPRWTREGLLAARWANEVVSWCVKYHEKYAEPPGKAVEALFAAWARKNADEATKTQVSRFLSSLSGDYEAGKNKDSKEALDRAGRHLNEVALVRLQEEVDGLLRKGLTEDALEAQQNFRPLNLSAPAPIDVLRDRAVQRRALYERQNVLVTYPGAAGEFFGDELAEDSFVAFMAPVKSFKSQMLLDVAWRAMRQHRTVAYVQVGDLSTNQVMRRFHKRAAYRPIKACSFDYPTAVVAPGEPGGVAVVDSRQVVYEEAITWAEARKAFRRQEAKTRGGLYLARFPTMGVNVPQVKALLEDWDQQGVVANVVIIDYAENLAPPRARKNPLDEIEESWALMRQLSETRRCLVMTASQANKEGMKAWVLTRSNFSGNKMKLAHVTSFLGVNATDEERSLNQMRLNFVVRREEKYNESRCLHCAMCLDCSNPIVVSAL